MFILCLINHHLALQLPPSGCEIESDALPARHPIILSTLSIIVARAAGDSRPSPNHSRYTGHNQCRARAFHPPSSVTLVRCIPTRQHPNVIDPERTTNKVVPRNNYFEHPSAGIYYRMIRTNPIHGHPSCSLHQR